jgi:hypothetical protein
MDCVLHECLGSSVPTLPRLSSPPYRGSSSAAPTEIAPIEEGNSRVSVESLIKYPLS